MASGATIATAYVQLVPTLEGVQGSLGQAFSDSGVDQKAEEAGKRTGSKWGGALTAAAGVAVGAAAAGGAALAGLYKIGATFDDVADTIQVATGKTGAQLDALTDSAKVIGSTVPVSFDKIAPALSAVSTRLGLTGGDLETVTSQFLALGEITGKDLNMDQATAAFNAFNITGADVSTQMDNLFKVSQATGVGIDDITASVQKSAPALQQLGFNFQSSAALVGQLDKAGINSQSVLGGMGKALVKLAKDGEEPQQAFQRVTGQIGDLVKQGDDAKAIDLASTLFGTKGATQFVEATKNGSLNVEAMTQALSDNQTTILGTAQDTADFAEQWTLFKNKALVALEPVGTAVFGLAGMLGGKLNDAFDVIVPAATALFDLFKTGDFKGGIFGLEEDSPIISGLLTFRDLIKDIAPVLGGAFKQAWDTIAPILMEVGTTIGGALVDVFKELWPHVKDLIPVVLQLFTAFNPISLIFHAILPMLPEIAKVFADLARTLGDVLGKALDVIVPMLSQLVDAIFPPLQDLIRALLPFVFDLVKIIGELAGVVGDALGKALDALNPLFQTLVGIISELIPYISDLVQQLLPPLEDAFEALVPLVQAVLDVIISLASNIIDALIPVIEALLPVVKTVFGFIADTIGNIIQVFHGLIDVVTGIFTGDWAKAWEGVKEIFGGIWDQIKNIFSTLWTLIGEFFTGIVPAIWGIVSGFAGQLAEWGGQLLGWLWDGIKAALPAILEWFGSLASWVWDQIVAFAGWLKDKGAEFIGWVASGISDGAQAVWNFFIALPGKIWDIFLSFEGWLGDRIWEFIHWFSDGIVAGADAIWQFFRDLPQNIWNIFLGFETWLGDRIWEFIHWFSDGISNGAQAIWDWFTDLPNKIWAIILGVKDTITGWGGKIVEWITQGIKDAANKVVDAVASVFGGISLSDNGELSAANGYIVAVGMGAGGGVLGGYAPGVDNIPYLLSPGEGVLVPEAVRMLGADTVLGINDLARGGRRVPPGAYLGGMAAGGIVGLGAQFGNWMANAAKGNKGIFGRLVQMLLGKNKSKLLAQFAPKIAGYNASAGVEQWRGLALQALAATGEDASNITALLYQMQTESSGNPSAINLTDINAQRGTPSIGLMQVIQPTFVSALSGTQFANLIPRGLYDPWANIISSILYARNRYGSLANAYRGVAYDEGGWLMPHSTPVNLLAKPEPVLSPDQWRIAEEAISQSVSARSGPAVVQYVTQQPGQSPADLARELDRLIMFTGAYV